MDIVITFIIIFGVLVFFHELGHLYFAKHAGILCREFAIGFGPKVVSFMKNETVYTIRLLPLGGYVRMAGKDEEMIKLKPGVRVGLELNANNDVTKIFTNHLEKYQDLKVIEIENADLDHRLIIQGYEDNSEVIQTFSVYEKAMYVEHGQEFQIAPFNRQFVSKSLGKRTMTIFAGPLMNFILAAVLLICIGMIQGIPVNKAEVGKIALNGAAYESGLRHGDKIVSIDNKPVSTWKEVVGIVQKNPNRELSMEIVRDGKNKEVTVTPDMQKTEAGDVGKIGVYQPTEKAIISALSFGFTQTYQFSKQILVGVGQLITGKLSIDSLSGPVGIYTITDEVAKSGIMSLMNWTAILSINLGIMNLLPLPALDGGRLMFFAVEALRGKPMDQQKESVIHFIGFSLLMLLMLVVTWNDIKTFFF
ncbi:RIP metalloprotease RseP [Cytobacillus massiliigabonensis]|uniref:RIP metalloprotease RseP n=1 Tax=Cytobacillus massiliigabonensis TaxID=1871011 RepID=UPI000C840A78|nr:RIP metalloprotease RseP [Cytobacillus massiliigabonensis]